jgi:hypothetical protein
MPSALPWLDATTACVPPATSDFALARAICWTLGEAASMPECALCALTGSALGAETVSCVGRSLIIWRTFGEAASPLGPDIGDWAVAWLSEPSTIVTAAAKRIRFIFFISIFRLGLLVNWSRAILDTPQRAETLKDCWKSGRLRCGQAVAQPCEPVERGVTNSPDYLPATAS